jgi:AcrR family transcriptional regulator
MTLAMVGERAGYSRGLATARFGSKGKLLEALVEELVARWSVETAEPEPPGLSGLEALRVLLTEIKDTHEKHPQSLGVLYALIFEAVGPIPELRERFVMLNRGFRSRIKTYLERGVQDGSIVADIDPEQQAAAIAAQVRGVGYLWKVDPDRIDSGAVLALYFNQVLDHLACDRTTRAPITRPKHTRMDESTPSGSAAQ